MFAQHFANYLLEKGSISKADYALVSEQQRKGRVKLGLIAVAENLLTKEQTEKLNALQRQTDR
ncbi:MAG: chemotaxis protein CheY, partial [Firmicutes bacterium]|nr:chemotaxis protein CheY [Bacillota bacterium]